MQRFKQALVGVLAALLVTPVAFAATTGKIAGRVTDAATGDPIPMVQVILVETGQGTVTDADGYYSIINIRPDDYTVRYQFVGYATHVVEGVQVVVDQTRTIDVRLQEEVIEGQEVVVTAERPLVEMGRTTTTSYVDEREMQALPVSNVGEVINLQAGVVDGHFRGGRTGEVMYMVNGVPINNPMSNNAGFTVEKNMVQGLEVISGVFGAEYGQAMSGVVNIVTKSVPNKWTGDLSYETGGILSTRDLEYVSRLSGPGSNLGAVDFQPEMVPWTEATGFLMRQDAQLRLGGPIISEKLGINVVGRFFKDEDNIPGRNLFAPSDSSQNLNSGPPETWIIESTGDGEFMNGWNRRGSLNSTLTWRITPRVKAEYNLVWQKAKGRGVGRKYVPEGTNYWYDDNQFHLFSLAFTLSDKSFANFNYSYMLDEGHSELYPVPDGFDPINSPILDPRYVANRTLQGQNAFDVRGNDLSMSYGSTKTHTILADYTNQINRIHQVKTGVSARLHNIDNGYFSIEVSPRTGWLPMPAVDQYGRDTLQVQPYELAAYVQDKMEFKNLIVNAGLRFDLFNPDFDVPIDWGQAGSEYIPNLPDAFYYDPEAGDSLYNRETAPVRWQLSPRVGIAFPISANGVIRFSAGLFFQTPRLDWIYQNPNWEVNPASSTISFGNASIDPERTLHFEIGLQQGLTQDMRVELTLFAKDIRNLSGQAYERDVLTTNYVTRFINVDVGSSRGITLELNQRPVGGISWSIDYTLQFASGTASDPGQAFQRFQSGMDDIKTLERLNWDRRHVLNNYITIEPSSGLAFTMINRFRTGTPYTTVRNFVTSYIVNNYDRPSGFTSDLRVYWSPPFITDAFQLQMQIDNLFDARIHESIYSDTGRADESVTAELYRRNLERGVSSNVVGGVNSLDEFFYGEGRFSGPRRVYIGARYRF